MKNMFLNFVAGLLVILFAGCASQSVYLQNLSVEGPQSQPPLFITRNTETSRLRLAPRLSLNDNTFLVGRTADHSNVNRAGVYQVDTLNENGKIRYIERDDVNKKSFTGRNFRWEPSRITASLNMDYAATQHVSFVAGMQYSSGSTQSYLAANAGAGFSFEGKNIATRVDVGAAWNAVRYDVDYIVTVAPFSFDARETEVFYFHESGRASNVNAYGALTLNSKVEGWPVQVFSQFAINRQTVVSLERRVAGASGKANLVGSVSFFLITPGIYFELGSNSRLLLGVQLRDETELQEADPGVLVSPFVQFEFGL